MKAGKSQSPEDAARIDAMNNTPCVTNRADNDAAIVYRVISWNTEYDTFITDIIIIIIIIMFFKPSVSMFPREV